MGGGGGCKTAIELDESPTKCIFLLYYMVRTYMLYILSLKYTFF